MTKSVGRFDNVRKTVFETLNFMYIDIYTYLLFLSTNNIDNNRRFVMIQNKYVYVRNILDRILEFQNNINKMIEHHDYDDLLQSQFGELITMSYDESVATLFRDQPAFSLRFKFTAYQKMAILNKETNRIDLFEILRKDAESSESKEAKEYFELHDEEYGMTLDKYFLYHDLPEKKEDLSDEQAVIKNMIEYIFTDLERNLKEYYFEIFQYIISQDDFSYLDLVDKITNIMICKDRIDYIVRIYLDKESSIIKYKDPNVINEEVYLDRVKFFIKHGDKLDKSKAQLYKNIALDPAPIFEFDLYQLLKKHAITEAAKKYFDLNNDKEN